MGAWSPHPCGSHPANPQCPAFDSWPAAVGGCRPLVGTSVRYRMNSSTHGVDLLATPAVGRCRPWSTRFFCQTSISDPVPTKGQHPPEQDAVPTDRRKLSKSGWVRLRGCERHGWRDQAPMGEGALLAKHCFASARTHSRQRLGRTPEGGLRRPPQPDPPRQPTECPFLTLTLPWLEAGAGLQPCNPYPLISKACAPAHPPAAGCTGTARSR